MRTSSRAARPSACTPEGRGSGNAAGLQLAVDHPGTPGTRDELECGGSIARGREALNRLLQGSGILREPR